MNKTVLLTGANGLLGQKITNLLANRPSVRLIATSVGENRNPRRQGYEYESLDITNFDQLKAIFKKYPFTDVINTAAMTNVDACENEPDKCQALNVQAVRYLCGLCKETNARLIHLSTDFIFDGENGPYKEQDTPNPLSVYGHAKWEAEKLIQSSGIRSAIIRTVLLYGMVPDMSRSNIVLWLKSSLEKGQTVKVVNDQYRTPTLAEDLADGVALVLTKEKTGLFNISGAEMYSILELAYAVADFWKLDKSLIQQTDSASLNQPAKRPPKTGFIILKAQTELGYKPHSLKEGLELLDRQLNRE